MAAKAPEKVVVRRKRKGGVTTTAVLGMFRQHRAARRERETAQAREEELKGRLMKALEDSGYVDEKGNRWIDLPEEVDGFRRLKRQRQAAAVLNGERAEAELTEMGLWEDATVTTRVIDPQKLAQLVWDGKLTKAKFDRLHDVNERFSFVPVK